MERKMNKVWIMVAVFFSWSFVALAAIRQVTFDVGALNDTTYRSFISELRGKLKSNVVSNTIPVLPAKVPVDDDNRYVFVILTSKESSTTIAMDVTNAYVLGFKVDINSYFFKDVDEAIYKSKRVFGDTTKERLPYGGGYQDLYNAKANREDVLLGISQLNNAVFRFVKYPTVKIKPDIASALLVVIEMLSEAARFTYIEEELLRDLYGYFCPRGDILSLQNSWSALSTAIQDSTNGNLVPTVQLQDKEYKSYTVSTVEEVKNMMGLLLDKRNASP